jgi:toxin ParE1/3/4
MIHHQTTPSSDADLIEGARWIRADSPEAARRFLDAAFASFDRLARFPQSAPLARLKAQRLAGMRFSVMPPPFNRWLIFYRMKGEKIEIVRVIYGTQNWRGKSASFFV